MGNIPHKRPGQKAQNVLLHLSLVRKIINYYRLKTKLFEISSFQKLEDLKVLKRSPVSDIESKDLNNVKLSHGQPELIIIIYYIPITDTTLELSVFWPSDTESRINELRFSESISLSFKTRLTSVTCFCGDVT